ncbi:protein sidekick-1-like [Dysidea avara]|uniref:protein sidekick-1-like n=1 Tax=Dysidea avara TaxID=196820 RepID=UPI003331BE25
MIGSLLLTFMLMSTFNEGQSVELTIEPTQLTVLLFTGRERVNVTCTASSPAVEIMWSINDTVVMSDVADVTTSVVNNKKISTLTLKRPLPSLSGRYNCFIPLLISDTFSTVRIMAPIYLVTFSDKIKATVGDNVTSFVSAFGLGLQTYSWDKSRPRNSSIKPDAVGTDTNRLLVPNVNINDAGRYTCTVTSKWSQNQTKIDLTVKYPSPVITTQPQNYTTFLSLPASLHCTATSSYPITYSWRRVGSSDGVSSEVTGQNTDTLVIPSLLHSDEGWYQCVVAVFGEETVSQSVYLTVKDLPAPQNLVVMMDVVQNRVSLSWTKPNDQILSGTIDLKYGLYYSMAGGCGVTTCKKSECRIERRRFNPKRNGDSESFGRTLSPYTNYTWRLELTYTRDGSDVATTETVVNVQTSQSGASAPTNLTVLESSFRWVNLTWSKPLCPNGVISHYRVCYNGSNCYKDIPAEEDYYVLTGLSTNTIYNISIRTITGKNIIGEHTSVVVMTLIGAPLIQPLHTDDVIVVNDDPTRGVVDVIVPPVSDQQGDISFIYILVSHDGKLKPSKSEASHSHREATDRGLVYYVTAALDYDIYNASNTFTLGDGVTSTGLNRQEFQNSKLSVNKEYYYFIRVYSVQYTPENDLVSSSSLYEIGTLQERTTAAAEKDDSSIIAIVAGIAAGLLLVIAVLIAIIVCCYRVLYSDSIQNRNCDAIEMHELHRPIPSQEVPANVITEDTTNFMEQSTPIEQSPDEVQPKQQSTSIKESKCSMFKFRGWKKRESKQPFVEKLNPMSEKLDQGQTDDKENREIQHTEEIPAILECTNNEVAVDVTSEKTTNNY